MAQAGSAKGYELVGTVQLGGEGGCMHVNVQDGYAYVGHMGGSRVGTSIVDVSDPADPRLVTQLTTPPGTRSHKVQVVGDTLLVNYERSPFERGQPEWQAGLMVYDVTKPESPEPAGFLPTPGKGVHRMTYWEDPYAYVTGSAEGWTDQILLVADVSDPGAPREVGRFGLPGMHTAAGEVTASPSGRTPKLHHALVQGDRAYCGWWDAGVVILDVGDPAAPSLVSHFPFGEDESANTHTAMPLGSRGLLVVTDEELGAEAATTVRKEIRMVDISDEERPRVVSLFPRPDASFATRPGRFGPHNLHEMRPGTYHSERVVHATYFNAGLRVYDTADPEHVEEIGHFVPASDGDAPVLLNDLTVDAAGLVYVTDRITPQLFILAPAGDLPA